MKKGDVVMIYQDPITQKKPEGKAKLLKLEIRDKSGEMEYWKVLFKNEDETYFRWVKI